MFTLDPEQTIEQQLSHIPPEFQEAFRHALEQELADSEQNRTDNDILHYLRERRGHFERGGFIRPDGRPGMVTMSSEELYDRAMPELMRHALGQDEVSAEKRQTLFKLIGFAVVAFLFVLFALRGRAQRNAPDDVTAHIPIETTPTITPALPDISGADESLKTIGGLGGALTIGRPSSLELHYSATETTLALPIDPSKPTTKGELRFNTERMASENPVAVWLFGTVLNYGIGIPDPLIRNLSVGDRIAINTDTGSVLHFVIARQWEGANHESSRLLSQDRTGLTLFALPALDEQKVAFAFASYDIDTEDALGQSHFAIGDPVPFASAGTLSVEQLHYTHNELDTIAVTLTGSTSLSDSVPIMLSLTTSLEQTAAVPLVIHDGRWEATRTLSSQSVGLPLFAELRWLPTTLAVVQLDEVPTRYDALEITVSSAIWQDALQRVLVAASIHNPTTGAISLPPDFIQHPQGGDVYSTDVQVTPGLPLLLQPGEAMGLQVSLPPQPSLQLQIGADLWELSGLSAVVSAETATTTDR